MAAYRYGYFSSQVQLNIAWVSAENSREIKLNTQREIPHLHTPSITLYFSTTSLLCDRYFGFSLMHKKANNLLQTWRVIAFYRIAPCLTYYAIFVFLVLDRNLLAMDVYVVEYHLKRNKCHQHLKRPSTIASAPR